ncbi:MAG: MNIO family bufferin maturase [Cellvibrionaceae bacterium]
MTPIQENSGLPNSVGISLKAEHYEAILETKPDIGWFECHPENYMGDGGLPHYFLSRINEHYPISMHGVGLSLGSADGIESTHLDQLAKLVDQYQPAQVSEHLAWSHWNSIFLNDLLPLPYTQDFLECVIQNIDTVQNKLKRSILIENPSVYMGFNHNEMSETEFLNALVKQTGCGLLLDINNVHVSSNNLSSSAEEYIESYPLHAVGEIHLAGHSESHTSEGKLLIDDHGSPVIDEVWSLFSSVMTKVDKPLPVLIEWDTNIPQLSTLVDEAKKAEMIMTDAINKGLCENHLESQCFGSETKTVITAAEKI